MASLGPSGDAETEARDRLLVVDPYGTSRAGLGAALRAGGFAVEAVEGSSEAIRSINVGGFDRPSSIWTCRRPTASRRTAGTSCGSCARRRPACR